MTSPYSEIYLESNEKIKVWDVLICSSGIRMPWENYTNREPKLLKMSEVIPNNPIKNNEQIGRVRVLAVLPKKPDPLDDIRFSVSWCSPEDMKHYNRERANKICVGRWLKSFQPKDNTKINFNCGVIPHLDTLKNFVENALVHMNGRLPHWACEDIKTGTRIKYISDDLNLRVNHDVKLR